MTGTPLASGTKWYATSPWYPSRATSHGTEPYPSDSRKALSFGARRTGLSVIFTLGSSAISRCRPSDVTVLRCAITTTCFARAMMLSSSMDGICAAVSMMTVSASGAGSVMAASVAGVATRIGFAAAKICGCSLRSLFNGTFREPASVVCSRLASCVREKSMSHRRRTDSWATIGPMERTCSTSTWVNRSAALCMAEPSWLEMMAEDFTMSSKAVVHHASCSSPATASFGTPRLLRSATSSSRPAEWNSRSRRARSGSVSNACLSSYRAFRRSSTWLRSTVSRLPPCGVVASATFNAVISFVSWSCVLMMSSSLAGSTGHPP